jgi:hypothetical protein
VKTCVDNRHLLFSQLQLALPGVLTWPSRGFEAASTTEYTMYGSSSRSESLMGAPPPQVVIQQQDTVIRAQDKALDQLSASVGMLHRMGNEIHGELITQVSLLRRHRSTAVLCKRGAPCH